MLPLGNNVFPPEKTLTGKKKKNIRAKVLYGNSFLPGFPEDKFGLEFLKASSMINVIFVDILTIFLFFYFCVCQKQISVQIEPFEL